MKRNRFEALRNEAEGFYMLDGEDHEDMYRRLKTIATAFSGLGAQHINDAWIKRKYVSALMPFEPVDLKSLQGRHKYHPMTATEVMQEMASFQVQTKLARDKFKLKLNLINSMCLVLLLLVIMQMLLRRMLG